MSSYATDLDDFMGGREFDGHLAVSRSPSAPADIPHPSAWRWYVEPSFAISPLNANRLCRASTGSESDCTARAASWQEAKGREGARG